MGEEPSAESRPVVERLETGIPGLDDILRGGDYPGRILSHPRRTGYRQDHPRQPTGI